MADAARSPREDGGTAHAESTYDTPEAARARRVAGDGAWGISLTGRSEGPPAEPGAAGEPPHPPGYSFAVISEGYGVMPAYAEALSPRERWAVVAWLRVLARSQRAPLDSAPPEVRQRLLQSLPGGTRP